MASRLRALALSTHPGPGIAVTAITVLLGVASGLDPERVALLGIVMLVGQCSVGLSNDAIDAERDRAVGRRDKPVARGDLSARLALGVALGAAAASVVLSLPLGWPAALAHVVFLASAWAYNVGLKRTALSALPYLVSFGTLPAIVTLARPEPVGAAVPVIAAGALLGLGAHFANVLPDLADDAATGVRGLPHRLGSTPSIVVTWAALLGAAVALAIALGAPLGIAGLVASAVIAAVGTAIGVRRGPVRGLFRLVIAAAVLDVVLLVLSGSRMTG